MEHAQGHTIRNRSGLILLLGECELPLLLPNRSRGKGMEGASTPIHHHLLFHTIETRVSSSVVSCCMTVNGVLPLCPDTLETDSPTSVNSALDMLGVYLSDLASQLLEVDIVGNDGQRLRMKQIVMDGRGPLMLPHEGTTQKPAGNNTRHQAFGRGQDIILGEERIVRLTPFASIHSSKSVVRAFSPSCRGVFFGSPTGWDMP